MLFNYYTIFFHNLQRKADAKKKNYLVIFRLICYDANIIYTERNFGEKAMDIFAKCYKPAIQDEAREKGIYPYFHALESRQDTEVIMEGKRRIMLG